MNLIFILLAIISCVCAQAPGDQGQQDLLAIKPSVQISPIAKPPQPVQVGNGDQSKGPKGQSEPQEPPNQAGQPPPGDKVSPVARPLVQTIHVANGGQFSGPKGQGADPPQEPPNSNQSAPPAPNPKILLPPSPNQPPQLPENPELPPPREPGFAPPLAGQPGQGPNPVGGGQRQGQKPKDASTNGDNQAPKPNPQEGIVRHQPKPYNQSGDPQQQPPKPGQQSNPGQPEKPPGSDGQSPDKPAQVQVGSQLAISGDPPGSGAQKIPVQLPPQQQQKAAPIDPGQPPVVPAQPKPQEANAAASGQAQAKPQEGAGGAGPIGVAPSDNSSNNVVKVG